jgi:hypothetical protein
MTRDPSIASTATISFEPGDAEIDLGAGLCVPDADRVVAGDGGRSDARAVWTVIDWIVTALAEKLPDMLI